MSAGYPIVTQVAFESFSCVEFEGDLVQGVELIPRRDRQLRSFLRADVQIQCHTNEHIRLWAAAFIAVAVYPLGALVLVFGLLTYAGPAVHLCGATLDLAPATSNRKTRQQRLFHAIRFLHADFKPSYFLWECMEMLRRFLLVGLYVIVPWQQQGSLLQLVLALVTALTYLVAQVLARPYLDVTNNYLAVACSLSLVVLLVWYLVLKQLSLTEIPEVREALSPAEQRAYNADPETMSFFVLVSLLASLGLAAGLAIMQAREARRQADRATRAQLHFVVNDRIVRTPKLAAEEFHLFLSHAWRSGATADGAEANGLQPAQDQMRIIKIRLNAMLPGVKVFLDVDDLKEGKGAESVDASGQILVLVSVGYFRSKNCMRELLRAVYVGRPLIALLEPEGGLDLSDVMSEIEAAHAVSWRGLTNELVRWPGEVEETTPWPDEEAWPPTPEAVYRRLFTFEALEWHRVQIYQNVTLRLIAERLLPSRSIPSAAIGQLGSSPSRPLTYFPDNALRQPLKALRLPQHECAYHLFYSRHNRYAQEVVEEMQAMLHAMGEGDKGSGGGGVGGGGGGRGMSLRVTTDEAQLRAGSCERCLVLLNGDTWAGQEGVRFKRALQLAVSVDVDLLMLHEGPSASKAAGEHHAVQFDQIMAATPPELDSAERSIYSQIAFRLEQWHQMRPVSIRLVLDAIVKRSPIHHHIGLRESGLLPVQPAQRRRRLTIFGPAKKVHPAPHLPPMSSDAPVPPARSPPPPPEQPLLHTSHAAQTGQAVPALPPAEASSRHDGAHEASEAASRPATREEVSRPARSALPQSPRRLPPLVHKTILGNRAAAAFRKGVLQEEEEEETTTTTTTTTIRRALTPLDSGHTPLDSGGTAAAGDASPTPRRLAASSRLPADASPPRNAPELGGSPVAPRLGGPPGPRGPADADRRSSWEVLRARPEIPRGPADAAAPAAGKRSTKSLREASMGEASARPRPEASERSVDFRQRMRAASTKSLCAKDKPSSREHWRRASHVVRSRDKPSRAAPVRGAAAPLQAEAPAAATEPPAAAAASPTSTQATSTTTSAGASSGWKRTGALRRTVRKYAPVLQLAASVRSARVTPAAPTADAAAPASTSPERPARVLAGLFSGTPADGAGGETSQRSTHPLSASASKLFVRAGRVSKNRGLEKNPFGTMGSIVNKAKSVNSAAAGFERTDQKHVVASSYSVRRRSSSNLDASSSNLMTDAPKTPSRRTSVAAHKPSDPRQMLLTQRVMGATAEEVREEGYTATQCLAAGYSIKELIDGGFGLGELRQANASSKDLHAAGVTAEQMRAQGLRASDMSGADFSPAELRRAGCSAAEAIEASRSRPAAMLQAGYSAEELVSAGVAALYLHEAGCSASQLRAAGCEASDLHVGGYGARDLKMAGFSSQEMRDAGYSDVEMNRIGGITRIACDAIRHGHSSVAMADRAVHGAVAAASDAADRAAEAAAAAVDMPRRFFGGLSLTPTPEEMSRHSAATRIARMQRRRRERSQK